MFSNGRMVLFFVYQHTPIYSQDSTYDGKDCVMKEMLKCENRNDENRLRCIFKREMDVMKDLDHRGCLKLYGCSVNPSINLPILVFPYCNGGCLTEYILEKGKRPRLSNEEKYQIILEIIQGLAYLHSRYIIHRDLKLDNILMHNGHPIISDFGSSRCIGKSIDILSSNGGDFR